MEVKGHQIYKLMKNQVPKIYRSEVVDEHNGVEQYRHPNTNPSFFRNDVR